MTDHEPVAEELADLFAAERAAPTIDAAVRSGLRSRLAAALAGVPLGHAAAASTALGGAGKLITVLAISVAAGGGTIAVVHHASTSESRRIESPVAPPAVDTRVASLDTSASKIAPPPVVDTPASKITSPPVVDTRASRVASAPATEPPAATESPVVATPPATEPPVGAELRGVASAPVTEPPAPANASPRVDTRPPATSTELDMVRDAWTALSSGDATRALDLVTRAISLYPHGVLDEERDAVQIVALARLHRGDDARTAASRFVLHHPTSVHRALIDRALEEKP